MIEVTLLFPSHMQGKTLHANDINQDQTPIRYTYQETFMQPILHMGFDLQLRTHICDEMCHWCDEIKIRVTIRTA